MAGKIGTAYAEVVFDLSHLRRDALRVNREVKALAEQMKATGKIELDKSQFDRILTEAEARLQRWGRAEETAVIKGDFRGIAKARIESALLEKQLESLNRAAARFNQLRIPSDLPGAGRFIKPEDLATMRRAVGETDRMVGLLDNVDFSPIRRGMSDLNIDAEKLNRELLSLRATQGQIDRDAIRGAAAQAQRDVEVQKRVVEKTVTKFEVEGEQEAIAKLKLLEERAEHLRDLDVKLDVNFDLHDSIRQINQFDSPEVRRGIQNIAQIDKGMTGLGRLPRDVDLDRVLKLDDAQARRSIATIAQIDEGVRGLGRLPRDVALDRVFKMDNAQARRSITTVGELSRQLENLKEVEKDLDPDALDRTLKAVERDLQSARRAQDQKRVRGPGGVIDIEGFRTARAEVRRLEAEFDRLNKKKIELKLDVDRRGLAGFRSLIGSTTRSLGGFDNAMQRLNFVSLAFRNTLRLIKWPVMIVGAGLAAQALSVLAAAATGLVSSLGTLSGLLVTIPAGLTALAQGVGTALLGFGGIGDAVSASLDEQSRALTDGGAAAEQAAQSTRQLQDAQRAAKEAQEDLTAARQEARFELERLRLEERGATLSVREARAELNRVARDEAASQLEVDRAQLALDEALDRRRQTRSERKTVEDRGGKTQAVIDAEKRLADTRRQLGDASKQAAAGTGALSAAQSKTQREMAKLSPAGREFARFLISLKPRLDDLRATAQKGILPGAEKGIRSALRNFGVLRTAIDETSRAMGRQFERAGSFAGRRDVGRDLGLIATRNTRLIDRMGRASIHFASAMRHILVAAGPLLDFLGKATVRFSRLVDSSAGATGAGEKMERFFERTRRTLVKVVSIAQSVGSAFLVIGNSARKYLGDFLLRHLDKAAQRFEEFAEGAEGKAAFKEFFENARAPILEMGRLLKALTLAFLEIGQTKGLTNVLRLIRTDLIPAFQHLIEQTTAAFGPTLITSLSSILRLITALAGPSGPLTVAVSTFGLFADLLRFLIEADPRIAAVVRTFIGLAVALQGFKLVAAITGFKTLTGLLDKFVRVATGKSIGARLAGEIEGPMKGIGGRIQRSLTGVRTVIRRVLFGAGEEAGGRAAGGIVGGFRGLRERIARQLGGIRQTLVRVFSRAGASAGEGAAAEAAGGIAGAQGRFARVGRRIGRILGRAIIVGVIAGIALLVFEFYKWELDHKEQIGRVGRKIGESIVNGLIATLNLGIKAINKILPKKVELGEVGKVDFTGAIKDAKLQQTKLQKAMEAPPGARGHLTEAQARRRLAGRSFRVGGQRFPADRPSTEDQFEKEFGAPRRARPLGRGVRTKTVTVEEPVFTLGGSAKRAEEALERFQRVIGREMREARVLVRKNLDDIQDTFGRFRPFADRRDPLHLASGILRSRDEATRSAKLIRENLRDVFSFRVFTGNDPLGLGRAIIRSRDEATRSAKAIRDNVVRVFTDLHVLRGNDPLKLGAAILHSRDEATRAAKLIRTNITKVFEGLADSIARPITKAMRIVGSALRALGASPKSIAKVSASIERIEEKAEGGFVRRAIKKARGGLIPGTGLHDTVPLYVPEGTAFATRHQQAILADLLERERMGFASGGLVPVMVAPGEYHIPPGEVPQYAGLVRRQLGMDLDEFFATYNRPHYAAQGGQVPALRQTPETADRIIQDVVQRLTPVNGTAPTVYQDVIQRRRKGGDEFSPPEIVRTIRERVVSAFARGGTIARVIPTVKEVQRFASGGAVSSRRSGRGRLQLPSSFSPTHGTAGLGGYPAVDVFAPPGTTVLSPVSGVVTRFSGSAGGPGGGGAFGYSMYISGGGKSYFLTHLGRRSVRVGQKVRRGQAIGTVVDYPGGVPDHVHLGVSGKMEGPVQVASFKAAGPRVRAQVRGKAGAIRDLASGALKKVTLAANQRIRQEESIPLAKESGRLAKDVKGAKDGEFVSTSYGPPWGGIQGTGVTRTGINLKDAPKRYIIAVDPGRVPLGSKVRVWPNPFGYRGRFLAGDTGGAIKGNRIDFYDWRGRKSQLRWGTKRVNITRAARGGFVQRLAQGGRALSRVLGRSIYREDPERESMGAPAPRVQWSSISRRADPSVLPEVLYSQPPALSGRADVAVTASGSRPSLLDFAGKLVPSRQQFSQAVFRGRGPRSAQPIQSISSQRVPLPFHTKEGTEAIPGQVFPQSGFVRFAAGGLVRTLRERISDRMRDRGGKDTASRERIGTERTLDRLRETFSRLDTRRESQGESRSSVLQRLSERRFERDGRSIYREGPSRLSRLVERTGLTERIGRVFAAGRQSRVREASDKALSWRSLPQPMPASAGAVPQLSFTDRVAPGRRDARHATALRGGKSGFWLADTQPRVSREVITGLRQPASGDRLPEVISRSPALRPHYHRVTDHATHIAPAVDRIRVEGVRPISAHAEEGIGGIARYARGGVVRFATGGKVRKRDEDEKESKTVKSSRIKLTRDEERVGFSVGRSGRITFQGKVVPHGRETAGYYYHGPPIRGGTAYQPRQALQWFQDTAKSRQAGHRAFSLWVGRHGGRGGAFYGPDGYRPKGKFPPFPRRGTRYGTTLPEAYRSARGGVIGGIQAFARGGFSRLRRIMGDGAGSVRPLDRREWAADRVGDLLPPDHLPDLGTTHATAGARSLKGFVQRFQALPMASQLFFRHRPELREEVIDGGAPALHGGGGGMRHARPALVDLTSKLVADRHEFADRQEFAQPTIVHAGEGIRTATYKAPRVSLASDEGRHFSPGLGGQLAPSTQEKVTGLVAGMPRPVGLPHFARGGAVGRRVLQRAGRFYRRMRRIREAALALDGGYGDLRVPQFGGAELRPVSTDSAAIQREGAEDIEAPSLQVVSTARSILQGGQRMLAGRARPYVETVPSAAPEAFAGRLYSERSGPDGQFRGDAIVRSSGPEATAFTRRSRGGRIFSTRNFAQGGLVRAFQRGGVVGFASGGRVKRKDDDEKAQTSRRLKKPRADVGRFRKRARQIWEVAQDYIPGADKKQMPPLSVYGSVHVPPRIQDINSSISMGRAGRRRVNVPRTLVAYAQAGEPWAYNLLLQTLPHEWVHAYQDQKKVLDRGQVRTEGGAVAFTRRIARRIYNQLGFPYDPSKIRQASFLKRGLRNQTKNVRELRKEKGSDFSEFVEKGQFRFAQGGMTEPRYGHYARGGILRFRRGGRLARLRRLIDERSTAPVDLTRSISELSPALRSQAGQPALTLDPTGDVVAYREELGQHGGEDTRVGRFARGGVVGAARKLGIPGFARGGIVRGIQTFAAGGFASRRRKDDEERPPGAKKPSFKKSKPTPKPKLTPSIRNLRHAAVRGPEFPTGLINKFTHLYEVELGEGAPLREEYDIAVDDAGLTEEVFLLDAVGEGPQTVDWTAVQIRINELNGLIARANAIKVKIVEAQGLASTIIEQLKASMKTQVARIAEIYRRITRNIERLKALRERLQRQREHLKNESKKSRKNRDERLINRLERQISGTQSEIRGLKEQNEELGGDPEKLPRSAELANEDSQLGKIWEIGRSITQNLDPNEQGVAGGLRDLIGSTGRGGRLREVGKELNAYHTEIVDLQPGGKLVTPEAVTGTNAAAQAQSDLKSLFAALADLAKNFGSNFIPRFAKGGVYKLPMAIVGEQGKELAQLPTGVLTSVGQEGPEIRILPVGTRIFSHPESKRIAKDMGIPGFQSGGTVTKTMEITESSSDVELLRAIKRLEDVLKKQSDARSGPVIMEQNTGTVIKQLPADPFTDARNREFELRAAIG